MRMGLMWLLQVFLFKKLVLKEKKLQQLQTTTKRACNITQQANINTTGKDLSLPNLSVI